MHLPYKRSRRSSVLRRYPVTVTRPKTDVCERWLPTGIPTNGCASLLKMPAFPALHPLLTRKQTSHLRRSGLSQPGNHLATIKLFPVSVGVPPLPVPSNTSPEYTRLPLGSFVRFLKRETWCPHPRIKQVSTTPYSWRAAQNLHTSSPPDQPPLVCAGRSVGPR